MPPKSMVRARNNRSRNIAVLYIMLKRLLLANFDVIFDESCPMRINERAIPSA